MWFFSHVYSIPIFGLFLNKYTFSLVKETLSKTSDVCWVMNMIALRHLGFCVIWLLTNVCVTKTSSQIFLVPSPRYQLQIVRVAEFRLGTEIVPPHIYVYHIGRYYYMPMVYLKKWFRVCCPWIPGLVEPPSQQDETLLLSKTSTKAQQLGWCLVLPNRHKIQGFWIHDSIQIQTESLSAVKGTIIYLGAFCWGEQLNSGFNSTDIHIDSSHNLGIQHVPQSIFGYSDQNNCSSIHNLIQIPVFLNNK